MKSIKKDKLLIFFVLFISIPLEIIFLLNLFKVNIYISVIIAIIIDIYVISKYNELLFISRYIGQDYILEYKGSGVIDFTIMKNEDIFGYLTFIMKDFSNDDFKYLKKSLSSFINNASKNKQKLNYQQIIDFIVSKCKSKIIGAIKVDKINGKKTIIMQNNLTN